MSCHPYVVTFLLRATSLPCGSRLYLPLAKGLFSRPPWASGPRLPFPSRWLRMACPLPGPGPGSPPPTSPADIAAAHGPQLPDPSSRPRPPSCPRLGCHLRPPRSHLAPCLQPPCRSASPSRAATGQGRRPGGSSSRNASSLGSEIKVSAESGPPEPSLPLAVDAFSRCARGPSSDWVA